LTELAGQVTSHDPTHVAVTIGFAGSALSTVIPAPATTEATHPPQPDPHDLHGITILFSLLLT